MLRRHVEGVPQLSTPEWLDLLQHLAYSARALVLAFAPDHFNYAFLQNQDRHVHCHVIARYATVRTFAGLSFEDPDYPGHYAVPAPSRRLTPAVMAVLAQDLHARFVEASTDGLTTHQLNRSHQLIADKEFTHPATLLPV